MFDVSAESFTRLRLAISASETPYRWIDYHAACFAWHEISRRAPELTSTECESLAIAVLILSHASSAGHTHLSLDELVAYRCPPSYSMPSAASWRTLFDKAAPFVRVIRANAANRVGQQSMPQAQLDLLASDALPEPEADDETSGVLAALVYSAETEKLSLQRFWRLQTRVDAWVAQAEQPAIDRSSDSTENLATVRQAFRLLFPTAQLAPPSNDLSQAIAALQCLVQPFNLINGGPGTGKTSTAAKILLLRLLSSFLSHNAKRQARCFLIAPTGKAAQRLSQSVLSQYPALLRDLAPIGLPDQFEAYVHDSLSVQGMTVHRYLIHHAQQDRDGTSNQIAKFADRSASVPDLVLIDESSMIDLQLMDDLLSTLAPQSCAIFLGDAFQLPPIEPGDVFADWVQQRAARHYSSVQLSQMVDVSDWDAEQLSAYAAGIADTANTADTVHAHQTADQTRALAVLNHSFRFGGKLAEIAQRVQQDDVETWQSVLRGLSDQDNVAWYEIDEGRNASTYRAELVAGYRAYFDLANQQASYAELYQQLDAYRILAAGYEGSEGVTALNDMVEAAYVPQASVGTFQSTSRLNDYHGKAVLLTKNMPQLGLFNGDVGIMIAQENGDYLLYFGEPDAPIVVSPIQLSGLQTAYAMTIHKSQGSEYAKLSIVLSEHVPELLSRPLLYTALTRTKEHCTLYASGKAIKLSLDEI